LEFHEARFVHHYACHLGRWLDCTDASRQFALKVPALVTSSPLLLEAVISLAARHLGDTEAANTAHDKCISMIIVMLGSDGAWQDDVLLCAIVILRVFEQLTAVSGTDQERHLAGCSALLRASQGTTLDLSAPTLREAAFWVYMRQCLYNACVHQQPPDVDFSLEILPIAPSSDDPVGDLKSETAWANLMTWICSLIVQFCFGGASGNGAEQGRRMEKWKELKDRLEAWARQRPKSFDPIWESDEPASEANENPFPDILFTADWHVIAYGFYQLSCILLIIYKPEPRFAIRSVQS
ncbi:hypothetical protein ACRALDRAFT_2072567, partial [Sodiomyces alcalophilus JCM 7366]|uniref:uncharacterized protein n=1 Tax=Sodiomyces alcalophilus JCM 7366 TaxID=591952 RepID=UPI0039B654C8